MTQTLCFKVRLEPTKTQLNSFSSHVGAARFAYNWAINHVESNWEAVKTNPNIEYVNTSAYGLRKILNLAKNEVAPWWNQNSKEAFASGTANAAKAIDNWRKSRTGARKGKPIGFPKYKTKHHDNQNGVTFTTGTRRLEPSLKHFTLPVIGTVKLSEKLNKMGYLLQQGATVGNVTLTTSQNHWWLAINIKTTDEQALAYFNRRHKRTGANQIGIDVGLKVFLTDSNGNTVNNPTFLRKSLKKLRKANKRLSRRRKVDKKTGEAPSNRWVKAHNQVVKTHAKIVNQRKDFTHQTTTKLTLQNTLIGIENLNIKGMVKNRHLSLSISDANWGEFKQQLIYKTKRYGTTLILVDTFYPSSKTCSKCKTVKTKLGLQERTYTCNNCGYTMDRDHNAAINIKDYAVAQSCGETLNGHGEESSGLTLLNETYLNEMSSEKQLLLTSKP